MVVEVEEAFVAISCGCNSAESCAKCERCEIKVYYISYFWGIGGFPPRKDGCHC